MSINRLLGKAGVIWIDLHDRYGYTQLIFKAGVDTHGETADTLIAKAREVGREHMLEAYGKVIKRNFKSPDLPVGDVKKGLNNLHLKNYSCFSKSNVLTNSGSFRNISIL